MAEDSASAKDIHSYAEPDKVRVKHCSLDLVVSFEKRTLSGVVKLHLDRKDGHGPLMLDMRDITVQQVRAGKFQEGLAESSYGEAKFEAGPKDAILGSSLKIELPTDADVVLIRYATAPQASGLQWLRPEQTAGKKHPFLFSQNESIHARSWIPIQDSPGVRVTYDARIKVPDGLLALMSADHRGLVNGAYEFTMELPVPAYLIALAVGDLRFESTGPRTGVYAEHPVLRAAATEFADTEKMIQAAEHLYGAYRWGRYDLLILPPSFPFGGMENPRLTFVTPTVIAGDKSLVGLVSHELAHSWSGNLVTNATWSDFWLNEGFTTYIENRIQEQVYGREQALMEQVLARRDLDKELAAFEKRDQILHVDLKGRDPDDGMTEVPYIKGALLLRQMEQIFGRTAFDEFLKKYFNHFSFESITTARALAFLRSELLDKYASRAEEIPVEQWVYQPGLPGSAPKAISERLESIHEVAHRWSSRELSTSGIEARHWSTQEWLEFLQVLPSPLPGARMAELDHAFHLTRIGNDEILEQWLLMSIANDYEPAYGRLESFLMQVGRLKYIRPLYTALVKTPPGQARARAIYEKARLGYHPIAQSALDKIVKA